MRIISTVPSITELLADLGLEKEVVGITKFCIHPETWYRNKERIGGTKTLNLEKIAQLSPTLVIANKEENVQEQIEQIQSYCNVLVTDIKTPEDNLELITELGQLTDKRMTAVRLRTELEEKLNQLSPARSYATAYLIWQEPYMSIGHDTYIHALMEKCGFRNIFSDKSRYPQTTLEKIATLKPEVILLSSEPYPFKEKHRMKFQESFPDAQVHLVDGEAFSWYGTRLIKTAAYLQALSSKINAVS